VARKAKVTAVVPAVEIVGRARNFVTQDFSVAIFFCSKDFRAAGARHFGDGLPMGRKLLTTKDTKYHEGALLTWVLGELCVAIVGKGLQAKGIGVLLLAVRWIRLSGGFEAAMLGTTSEKIMQWTAPAFEEVCLNCEINSYASAKL
jgi:coenzyme PQQ precursor peptide PqqA